MHEKVEAYTCLGHDERLGAGGVYEAGDDSDHESTLWLAGRASSGDTHKAREQTVVGRSGVPVVQGGLRDDDGGESTGGGGDSRGHHRLCRNTGEVHDVQSAVFCIRAAGRGRGGKRGEIY